MNSKHQAIIGAVAIVVIIVLLIALFIKKGEGEFYELSHFKDVVAAHIEDGYKDLLKQTEKDPVYRLLKDNKRNYDKKDDKKANDVLDFTPRPPATFLSEASVGERSGIKRSKPEAICNRTLEKIYKKKFSRARPDWLVNPKTKRKLELDCYNEELGIACEYNGVQHYKWPNFTNMTKQQFEEQVWRDNHKIDTCDARGVYLITVPYNIPNDVIPAYIEYYLPENVRRRQEYGVE